MVQNIAVSEEESGEILFKFPIKQKVDEALEKLSEQSTNSIEKLKDSSSKLVIKESKLGNNKFGLVLEKVKSSVFAKLKKRHGPVKVEVRSRVLVLWFDTKLSLFKALTDERNQKYRMDLSVHNFYVCIQD